MLRACMFWTRAKRTVVMSSVRALSVSAYRWYRVPWYNTESVTCRYTHHVTPTHRIVRFITRLIHGKVKSRFIKGDVTTDHHLLMYPAWFSTRNPMATVHTTHHAKVVGNQYEKRSDYFSIPFAIRLKIGMCGDRRAHMKNCRSIV